MSRVFKTKTFSRWMKKTLLKDSALVKAVDEMERGLIDADLGGNSIEEKIYKKRVTLPGRGKSGSTRTIVATSKAGRWFFLVGYDKNEKDNILDAELRLIRDIAQTFLSKTDEAIAQGIESKQLEEICYERQ